MLISFFMSCDNVMMMCISFLVIELSSSNQVCFLHPSFFLSLWSRSRMSHLYQIHSPKLLCSLVPQHSSTPKSPKYLEPSSFLAMNFKIP